MIIFPEHEIISGQSYYPAMVFQFFGMIDRLNGNSSDMSSMMITLESGAAA